jgi:hypothetical protein
MKPVAWMVVAPPHYCTPFADEAFAKELAKLHGGEAFPLVYEHDARRAIAESALAGFEAGILSTELPA